MFFPSTFRLCGNAGGYSASRTSFCAAGHTTNAEDDRYDPFGNNGGSDSVPVAWEHPGVGKRNRTRSDFKPRSSVAAFAPGLKLANHSRSKHGTLPNSGRSRAQPYLATLKETRWVLSGPNGAASHLGLNRSTLYFRMKKLGIARSVDSCPSPQREPGAIHYAITQADRF